MKIKNGVAAALAIMAMTGFLAVFLSLALKEVPAANKDFFNTALIALVGLVGTAFGFYLGSSFGSAAKNDLLAQANMPPPAIAGDRKKEEL